MLEFTSYKNGAIFHARLGLTAIAMRLAAYAHLNLMNWMQFDVHDALFAVHDALSLHTMQFMMRSM